MSHRPYGGCPTRPSFPPFIDGGDIKGPCGGLPRRFRTSLRGRRRRRRVFPTIRENSAKNLFLKQCFVDNDGIQNPNEYQNSEFSRLTLFPLAYADPTRSNFPAWYKISQQEIQAHSKHFLSMCFVMFWLKK